MHSAVCSSVSVGVTRPLLEGSRVCCNVRRGHHSLDCQAFSRPGFGNSKKSKEGPEFSGLARKTGFEKPRAWIPFKAAADFLHLAASEGTTPLNGSAVRSNNGWTEARAKFDEAMPSSGGDQGKNLVHALHEAASVFLSAMEEQQSLTRGPWFAQKWLGIDKNAWMKTLAYQAAVHSLLQAVQEIAARGEGRDRDAHIFVQRSLMRQSAPLKDSIRQELSSRDPSADDWLWLQQHPQAVASFVVFLEKDKRFASVTSTGWEGAAASPSKASDVALLTLSLSSSAAVMKLGAAALSCPSFSSSLSEEISRQMQKLPESMSMEEVYSISVSVGLKREFLDKFGARAADVKKWEVNEKEGAFWVDLVQQLLRAALVREGVRSKLKATDSVEVLEKDLAMFGFFVALGRSTRAYLAGKGVGDSEESLASLLRYLDGGCVLFYPQLASVPSYQLFVEVVCEEMAWLPFYPGNPPVTAHGDHDQVKSGVGKAEKQMAIAVAVQMCSLWVDSFVHDSIWVLQPQGFRAAAFLQKSQERLMECNRAYNLPKQDRNYTESRNIEGDNNLESLIISDFQTRAVYGEASSTSVEDDLLRNWDGPNVTPLNTSKLTADRMGLQEMERQLKLFDKELQSVELAMGKLEMLVKESESNGASGRELSAVRADLEKIWSLKREVEALEASLKAKAGLLEKNLTTNLVERDREGNIGPQERGFLEELDSAGQLPITNVQSPNKYDSAKILITRVQDQQGAAKLGQGLVNLVFPFSDLKKGRNDIDEFAVSNSADGDEAAVLALAGAATVSKEVEAFEQLRGELAALEYRVRQSAGQSKADRPLSEGDLVRTSSNKASSSSSSSRSEDDNDDAEVAGAYGDVFSKSIDKLKGASADAWRGTRLLGTDVGTATVLLRRSVAGQALTDREQKILKRTFTDLASIIPIGFLMLLPVTAVGHAAILAAIQKYVPALIPSAYGRERLDVLRRLEQLKILEPGTAEAAASPTPRQLKGGSTRSKSS